LFRNARQSLGKTGSLRKIRDDGLKQIEVAYQYHVATINNKADYERSLVMTDIQATIGFVNIIINAKSSRKRKNKTKKGLIFLLNKIYLQLKNTYRKKISLIASRA
jgi:hypothetical protein